MTTTPTQKERARIARTIKALDVPKRYSIKTPTMSDADKTRLIQRGNAR